MRKISFRIFNWKPQRGFSLVEVLIAAGLIAMGIMGLSTVVIDISKTNQQLELVRMAFSARTQFAKLIQSESVWQRAIAQNDAAAMMQCLDKKAKLACTPSSTAAGYSFKLYDDSGNELTPDGIFQYDLFWRPVCPPVTTPCKNPIVQVQGNLRLKTSSAPIRDGAINFAQYKLDLYRGASESTIEVACLSLGGTYDPTTNTCRSVYSGKSCPPRQVVKSLDPNGNLVCGYLFEGSCNVGYVLAGFNTDGSIRCVPKSCITCTAQAPACESGTLVTRDSCGKVLSTGGPCVGCGPDQPGRCEVLRWVVRDGCGAIKPPPASSVGNDPRCMSSTSATPSCVPAPSNWYCQCPPCMHVGPTCAATCGTPPSCCLWWCESAAYVPGTYRPSYTPSDPAPWTCPMACPAGTFSATGSSSACAPCPAGTYSGGSATSCANAGVGFWAPGGGSSALSCTNGQGSFFYTSSGGGSNNCLYKCNPGFAGTTCTPCGPGSYESGGSCVVVGIGQWAPGGGTSANACSNGPPNSHYISSGGGSNSCGWDCDAPRIGASCDLPPTTTTAPPGS